MTDPQDLINQATTIHEAATPGPFRMESQVSLAGEPRYCIKAGPDGVRSQLIAEEINDADARLFATARALLPQLSEALKYELKQTARLQDECDTTALEVSDARGERDVLDRAWKKARQERDEARAEVSSLEEQLKSCAVRVVQTNDYESCNPADYLYSLRCGLCHKESEYSDDEDELKPLTHDDKCLMYQP